HADAILSGITHVERRAPDGLCTEEKAEVERTLIAQAMSGASPVDIGKKARELGNDYAAESGGLPAGEDRSINEFSMRPTGDGRLTVRGDLDAVIGEKLTTAIESLNRPRPEPDGSDDARTSTARNADALEMILDAAAVADTHLATPPKTHVDLVLPAAAPERARLLYLGPISATTAKLLLCDAETTEVVVDGDTVPLQMGTNLRRFPPHLRRAIIIRDQCCIKCGAPGGRTHVHHIEFWSNGGPTDLDNGCLLCPSCHAFIHATDWDIILGADRHPWLIPPAAIDRQRRQLPAYNRRTLTLDDPIAA
ncbi:HNH endonuclease, partial [Gordonia sp. CPCC 205515]|uniref:HNH endonuclease n=1 Tax=Gordonia sp. CPCC 205515 TaxID=3140791 RepID=UPI003AF3407F